MSTQIYTGTSEKDGKLIHDSEAPKSYKSELLIPVAVGFCKNCFRERRHGSAYCGKCQGEPERMKIYQEFNRHLFPYYKQVVGKFGLTEKDTEHIAFTCGDTIYCYDQLSYGLVAHEITHVFQQMRIGSAIWWKKYLQSPDFRLGQELEAYQQQYRILRKNDLGKAEMELTRLAGDLSGAMYGGIIDFDEAIKKIKGNI